MRRQSLCLASLTLLAVAGCKPSKPAQAAQAASAASGAATLQGKVLEHLAAGRFSYLRLQTAQGEVWAGVPAADLKPGDSVKVVGATLAERFESKAANRTFDKVYLGTLEGQSGASVDAAHGNAAPAPGTSPHAGGLPAGGGATADAILQSMTGGSQHGGAAPATPGTGAPRPEDAKVEKLAKPAGAEGRSIAEVHAQQAALKDRPVLVRGKVVKYNAQILGKNWLHLQDGSGDPKAGTHDLLVTSADTAKVGDVVTARGTVRLKKDFGAGYAYDVLVEDAKVSH
ncbi:MAG: hypothetical protein U0P81_03225 [Holophagaceae bacterium]